MIGCVSAYLSIYKTDFKTAQTVHPYTPEPALIAPNGFLFEHQSITHPTHGFLQSFWSELVLTTFFVSVILSAKYLNGANDLFLNALTIGLTLFTCVAVGGKVSGGCFNPAVGLV